MACSTSPGLGNPGFHPLAPISRSNSAKIANNPAIARPTGVVKSKASLREIKPTPRSWSSWSVLMRSERERPSDQADDNGIDRPSACRLHGTSRCRRSCAPELTSSMARTMAPTALRGIGRHGVALEREGLLFLGRDTRIEPESQAPWSPWPKTLLPWRVP